MSVATVFTTKLARSAAGLALAAALAGGAPATLADTAVLLKNGLIHTEGARGSLKGSSVLIVGGRVTAVGPGLTAPEGATVIDLNGRPVTPALFGGVGSLGVAEVSEEASTIDSVLKLGQMRPEFDPSLAFNPDSIPVTVSRADGIGFALVVPSAEAGHHGAAGSSSVAGQASVARLDGRAPMAPIALSVVLGEGGALAGDSRAAVYMLLGQALEEARNPAAATSTDAHLLTAAGRRVLRSVLTEQRPLLIAADRASDIRTALEFAAREKLKVIIQGGAEAWRGRYDRVQPARRGSAQHPQAAQRRRRRRGARIAVGFGARGDHERARAAVPRLSRVRQHRGGQVCQPRRVERRPA